MSPSSLIAWLLSENRRAVPWRIVIAGALLQIVLAALLLKVPLFRDGFSCPERRCCSALEQATQAGTSFVFGFLGGGPQPFEERPGTSSFVLAFRALPLILVVSALSSLLFYWRVLPVIVRAISAALEKTMGVGGAVGLSAAANIFVGMVEAPLFVRPYLKAMSRGELFIVMTCGMAGIAGTVMVLYASDPGPGGAGGDGPHPVRLHHQRAGGDPDRGGDGAAARGADRRASSRCRSRRRAAWTR